MWYKHIQTFWYQVVSLRDKLKWLTSYRDIRPFHDFESHKRVLSSLLYVLFMFDLYKERD